MGDKKGKGLTEDLAAEEKKSKNLAQDLKAKKQHSQWLNQKYDDLQQKIEKRFENLKKVHERELDKLRKEYLQTAEKLEKSEEENAELRVELGELKTKGIQLAADDKHIKYLEFNEREAVLRQFALDLEFYLKKKYVIPALPSTERALYYKKEKNGEAELIEAKVDHMQLSEVFKSHLEIPRNITQGVFNGKSTDFDAFRGLTSNLKFFSSGGAHPITWRGEDITWSTLETISTLHGYPAERIAKMKHYGKWLGYDKSWTTAASVKAKRALP